MSHGGRAVFIDRDGTMIVDVGYPSCVSQVELLPDATAGLVRLQRAGLKLVIVSNQSGVGRGLVRPEQARAVHDRLVEELGHAGVSLDAAYYCPHAPTDGCDCRKPSPGLLLRAAGELGVALTESFMIGDRPSDIEAGRRAGCRTILLTDEGGASSEADLVATSWAEICDYIERSLVADVA